MFLTHSMVEREQLEAGVGLEVFRAIEFVHALFHPGSLARSRSPPSSSHLRFDNFICQL